MLRLNWHRNSLAEIIVRLFLNDQLKSRKREREKKLALHVQKKGP